MRHRSCLLILSVLMLLFFSVPAVAEDGEIILEAKYLEWGNGYLEASQEFDLWYYGKHLTGDTLSIDILNELYSLNQVSFTACKKSPPHYQILAKRVTIYEKEKIIFSGARIKIGSIIVPMPFDLTLEYHDGHYDFPEWLPELFISLEDGIGVRYTMARTFFNKLATTTTVFATTSGKYQLALNLDYLLAKNLNLSSELIFDQGWDSEIELRWENKGGSLGGKVGWEKQEDETEKTNLVIDYLNNGWSTKLTFEKELFSKFIPDVQLSTPMYNLEGINLMVTSGVALEKDRQIYHNKVYTTLALKDQYNFGERVDLGWKLEPGYVWVEDYSDAYNLKSAIWMQANIMPSLDLNVEYGRRDIWGSLPTNLTEWSLEEYVNGGISYSSRNTLDEGWDLDVLAKYNLRNRKFSEIEASITRAFDCYNLEFNIDILHPTMQMGINLKY